MSSKITQAQLDANQATYGIDDYRKMVNYTSGTNKGYVRFTKDSNGKLKLEKFNNKIDVPLSWRSNTSAAHNKAVREKFLNALEHDLKYMGDSANSIRKLVLAPKVPGKDVEDAGKALSRRELQKILAREVTVMVHGQKEYENAVEASQMLFGKGTVDALRALDERTFLSVFGNVPQFALGKDALPCDILEMLAVRTGIFPSKGEARKNIQNGGVSINKERVADTAMQLTDAHLLNGKYILVQRGKKNYYILSF